MQLITEPWGVGIGDALAKVLMLI